jgi:hypothetical protein
MKFRKRPIEIDAIEVTAIVRAYNSQDDTAPSRLLPSWFTEAAASGIVSGIFFEGVDIETLEGKMFGGRGDWIIRDINGEIYPCKADIFEASYDQVET